MIKKINLISGIFCYILSFLLVVSYLISEFSIIDLTSPIKRLYLIGLIILLMYIGSILLNKYNNVTFKRLYKINFIVWFILYIVMLFNLTLFDKYFGREMNVLRLINDSSTLDYINYHINVRPFATIDNYLLALSNHNLTIKTFIYNIYGNIVVFMPFALFLPRLFKIDKWYKYFIVVSIIIILIELLQLFMRCGSFDVDDYLLNIFGSMLMYFILNNRYLKNIVNKVLGL